MPLFSIIIPTYNSAKTLAVCLSSVLQQQFRDFEVLIIDGLSTDNTLSIATGFNDDRIKIFPDKDNGIYDAMNKGLKQASGTWLMFIGSDDSFYDSGVLSDMAIEIKKSEACVVYGNAKIKGDAGWAVDGQVYDGPFDLQKLLTKNICHQAITYHRKIFEEIGGFNTVYKICADYDFNLRAFGRFPFQYIDRIICWFNGGGTSIINDDAIFSRDKELVILSSFKKQLWRKEFLHYKNLMRQMSAANNSKLGTGTRINFLFGYIIQQLRSIKIKLSGKGLPTM